MVAVDVPFACRCGKVHGHIKEVAPNRGNHLKCYCKDCQTAANALGYKDSLDPWGGTEIFQTVPSKVVFEAGIEHLACLRLSPKGLLRWYASCCNAPLFTMLPTPLVAVAGLNMARIRDADRPAFGPLAGVYSASGKRPDAPDDLKDWGIPKAFALIGWRSLKAKLRGDYGAPFFDRQGQPIARPRVLTLEERQTNHPG